MIGIALCIGRSHQIWRNDELQRFGTNARAIRNNEIAQTEKRFVLFPHGDVQKSVGADDEKNAVTVTVICMTKVADCVDRIVQLRTGKIFARFGERWNEMWMLGGGKRHHRVTMRKRREMLFELVRRPAGGNEMNFVEIETPVRSA